MILSTKNPLVMMLLNFFVENEASLDDSCDSISNSAGSNGKLNSSSCSFTDLSLPTLNLNSTDDTVCDRLSPFFLGNP